MQREGSFKEFVRYASVSYTHLTLVSFVFTLMIENRVSGL